MTVTDHPFHPHCRTLCRHCRTPVGLHSCRTVGLSDLSDCRTTVGLLSESTAGLSDRGSAVRGLRSNVRTSSATSRSGPGLACAAWFTYGFTFRTMYRPCLRSRARSAEAYRQWENSRERKLPAGRSTCHPLYIDVRTCAVPRPPPGISRYTAVSESATPPRPARACMCAHPELCPAVFSATRPSRSFAVFVFCGRAFVCVRASVFGARAL